MDMGDGGCVEYILYVINGAGRGEWGEAIPEPAPNQSWVLKKFSKPVPNPVIKIDPRPIRGGAGRVPEKTRPIAIPNSKELSLISDCFGDQKSIKTPKLNTI